MHSVLVIKDQHSHARTGAKVGSNCTPKVQIITKPEENWRQDWKGSTNY